MRDCFIGLSNALGDARLFCGKPSMQVGSDAMDLPGMTTVSCLSEAMAALDTIVTQGEGGRHHDESHFARFLAIRGELEHSQDRREPLQTAWPAARNPLMRKPSNASSGVHITQPVAAAVLGLGNAFYALTLRRWHRRGSGEIRIRAGPTPPCRRPCG